MSHTLNEVDQMRMVARQIRRWIVESTHHAGSGHPTSSLSAVELMTALFFHGHFRFDIANPDDPNNDRLIFSKGHASPLFYSLWAAAGAIKPEQLQSYREFGSDLEGHPTSRFAFTEAATGSLGQGLSVGMGMALAARYLDRLRFRTFVLLGDSEMAEGSQWEAIQLASHYKLDNLIGILDVNRLGQRGPTMTGHDLDVYCRRLEAFNWTAIPVEDGHDFEQIHQAYEHALDSAGRPVMIVARTLKGKGVSQIEDVGGWHGKALDDDQLKAALAEIGESDFAAPLPLEPPERVPQRQAQSAKSNAPQYERGDEVATRQAYGKALVRIASEYPELVALDAEVSNSTGAKEFADAHPDRFFEMFIAEQNMVGAATGLALRGYVPFVSTFAAFLSRAFDQIRMAPHSGANIKFAGSHAGVSIGQDGPSQMGLEDIALFRTIPDSTIVYPCDARSAEHLVQGLLQTDGIGYIRTTRSATPVIYGPEESFPIGGSKVLRRSESDEATIIAAGITVFEALKAHQSLQEQGRAVRVIDLYSIKPIDEATVCEAAEQTRALITVEDHYEAGGIGEAVRSALGGTPAVVRSLAVRKKPRSGSPEQLLADHGLDAQAILREVDAALAQ